MAAGTISIQIQAMNMFLAVDGHVRDNVQYLIQVEDRNGNTHERILGLQMDHGTKAQFAAKTGLDLRNEIIAEIRLREKNITPADLVNF